MMLPQANTNIKSYYLSINILSDSIMLRDNAWVLVRWQMGLLQKQLNKFLLQRHHLHGTLKVNKKPMDGEP